MKKILVPVDFSPLCESLMDYIAALGKDAQVGEVVLIKVFHVSSIVLLWPSPDMLLPSIEEIDKERQAAKNRVNELAGYLRQQVAGILTVNTYLVEAPWQIAMEETISLEYPDLLVIGHDPQHKDAEDELSKRVIPFTQQSPVPVLLVPYGVKYKVPKHILIPTAFENMERLVSFRKLFQSKLWRSISITVLHITTPENLNDIRKLDWEALNNYLLGFFYEIIEITDDDIVKAILNFADQHHIDLIFALPAKHSFLYHLFHHGITRPFALHAKQPVLLLK
jgi:nucleotide-binding universal stress UspA family protein